MKLTDREKSLVLAGYINGYERGHNDTVDSNYTDAEDSAADWLADAIEDGGLEYSIECVTKSEEPEYDAPCADCGAVLPVGCMKDHLCSI